MNNSLKQFFDLDVEDDAELLRDILKDLSDLEDDDDDTPEDELYPLQIPRRSLRIGADVVRKEDDEAVEVQFDEVEHGLVEAEDTPSAELDSLTSHDDLTEPSTSQSTSRKNVESSTSQSTSNESVEPSTYQSTPNENVEVDILSNYFEQVERSKIVVGRGKRQKKVFKVLWNNYNSPMPNTDCSSQCVSGDDCNDVLTPLDYFLRYLPNTFFESTAFYTNLFAEQQQKQRFTKTSADEIKKLFGLHIIMGNLKLPRVSLYWDRTLKMDVFPSTMARDRFFQLRVNLHFVNNFESSNSNDRFFKVRPLYESIRNRCLQIPLEEMLAVDEQMVPFRGKFDQIQYVKGKPCPWGIKIFFLCGKFGYPYDFIIYQGERTELDSAAKLRLGMAAGIVYTLAERRIKDDKHHELYYDNYFSSYHLLRLLKLLKIDAGGTIRVNRFFNPTLTDDKTFLKRQRGISEELSNEYGDVTIVKWLDSRSVVMASNFIGTGEVDKVRRWDKAAKEYIEIDRPEIIKKYNHAMGGVDLLDQMISLYRIFIRSRKWTLRMSFHGVEVAAFAAWKEYQNDANKNGIPVKKQYDLLKFRMVLADQLIYSTASSKKKRGRPSLDDDFVPSKKSKTCEQRPYQEIILDNIAHLPKHDANVLPTRCKKPGCIDKTHIICVKCKIHLCINRRRNCFFELHTKAGNRQVE